MSQDSSLGLPLGLQASNMVPDGVTLLSFCNASSPHGIWHYSRAEAQDLSSPCAIAQGSTSQPAHAQIIGDVCKLSVSCAGFSFLMSISALYGNPIWKPGILLLGSESDDGHVICIAVQLGKPARVGAGAAANNARM